jgi:hypothetical protein
MRVVYMYAHISPLCLSPRSFKTLEAALKAQEEQASQHLARSTHAWRLCETHLREDLALARSELQRWAAHRSSEEVVAHQTTTQHAWPSVATTDDDAARSTPCEGRPCPLQLAQCGGGPFLRVKALHASFHARVLAVCSMLARGSTVAHLPLSMTQTLLKATELLWTNVQDQCFDTEESTVPMADNQHHDEYADTLKLMGEQLRLMDALSSELARHFDRTLPPAATTATPQVPHLDRFHQLLMPTSTLDTALLAKQQDEVVLQAAVHSTQDRLCCAVCLIS